MEGLSMYTTPDTQAVKRHPVRGLLWGLLLGVGLTGLLILTNVVAIGTITPWVILIFCVLFGIAWGLFAPPKKAKGDPPLATEPLPPSEAVPPGDPAAPAEPAAPVEAGVPEATTAEAFQQPVVKAADGSDSPATVIDAPGQADEPEA
jgi:hypothetical protein